jgi:hypothetical protein
MTLSRLSTAIGKRLIPLQVLGCARRWCQDSEIEELASLCAQQHGGRFIHSDSK